MEKTDKAPGDKGILARTATYTSKRARRAQEKLMQKVGKSDETKDEVFDEFLANFNKQQSSGTRLMKELRNYVQCVSSMQVATDMFAEAIREVYEDEWCQKDEIISLFEKLNKEWLTLHRRLSEEVLEPLNSYHKPFADVKSKISKRGRKLVDYDHCRHTVDTFRAKGTAKSSDAKRLQQAEDEYQRAKAVFLELTSDLYEELPALYDSRISFYVSCFQSIFTLEGVFHREATLVNNQLNEVLDNLVTDVSTGSYSTRKPFPAAVASDDTEPAAAAADLKQTPVGSLATFYDVAVPEDENNHETDSPPPPESDGDAKNPVSTPPSAVSVSPIVSPRPNDVITSDSSPKILIPPRPITSPVIKPPAVQQQQQPQDSHQETTGVTNGEVDNNENENADTATTTMTPTPQPLEVVPPQSNNRADTPGKEQVTTQHHTADPGYKVPVTQATTENAKKVEGVPPDVGTSTPKGNRVVSDSIFKVIATFNYAGEDEDELSFDKGELIHVIEFEDPDDQDEGWLYGVMDSSGVRGMFPENFTKRLT